MSSFQIRLAQNIRRDFSHQEVNISRKGSMLEHVESDCRCSSILPFPKILISCKEKSLPVKPAAYFQQGGAKLLSYQQMLRLDYDGVLES